MSRAQFNATIRAFASITNPLQTRLDIVLTDFNPNGNNQCIPISEAENIIKSALHQPLKINYQNGGETGHDNSYPIGTLTDVYLDGDVIRAKSVLWKTEFSEEDEYLKRATAEGKTLQTSWELYYKESEQVEGIDYLRDCQFSATVIVSNPAYGGRTPILSIAEQQKAELMDELETLRAELETFYNWISNLYEKTYQIEEAERNADKNPDEMVKRMEKVSNKITDMMSQYASVKAEKDTLETRLAELEASKAELQTQIDAIEKEKADKAKAEQDKARIDKIKTIVDEFDESFVLSLSEEGFTSYLTSLEKASKKTAKSSATMFIPEPYGSNEFSISDIASAFKEERKKERLS